MDETYQELKSRQQAEIETLPIFWAFSKKQFEEGLESFGLTTEDTGKLYNLPGGGFIRKTDSHLPHEMFEKHRVELDQAIQSDETGANFIFDMFDYELGNHEYCITMDVEPTIDALGLTMDEVKQSPTLTIGLALARKAQWATEAW